MKPQCVAAVENPIATDHHKNGTNGTGNYYERVYSKSQTGDTLDKDYANDTAATAKNRRAGISMTELLSLAATNTTVHTALGDLVQVSYCTLPLCQGPMGLEKLARRPSSS